MVTRNLSIMFTDIKGFTQRTSDSSREAMKELFAQHERLLVPVFSHFAGTIVKTIGDAFLVHFESPTDAVLCGVTIQEVLRQYNEGRGEEQRLEVRVAINVGEVELSEDDVMGDAVNIAARLEGVTEAGEVWFTDAVYQNMNRSEAPSAEVGERVFKGIPHSIRVYKVIQEAGSELAQHLAQSVSLSDGIPQLAGIRQDAPATTTGKSSRCIRSAQASISLLLLLALVVYLMPSTEEMALEKTQQLMAEGNPADALVIADKVLSSDPDSKELKAVAIAAASAQLDKLVAMGDIKAAQGWLRRQLEVKPYLDPLRVEIMKLDARATVNVVLNESRYADEEYPEPLEQFLSHYTESAEAPYYVLTLLEGKKLFRATRLWLMRTALERGYTPDERIYRFHIAQMEGGRINHELFESIREILLKYYPEQSRAWAAEALNGSNVMAFMNGWAMLKEAGAKELEEPYYQGLNRLINTIDVRRLDQSRRVLSEQTESQRRTQVLAFLGELVETFPKFINSTILRDEITRFRDGLKQAWAL
jgi:class 3 adenylate cyclase